MGFKPSFCGWDTPTPTHPAGTRSTFGAVGSVCCVGVRADGSESLWAPPERAQRPRRLNLSETSGCFLLVPINDSTTALGLFLFTPTSIKVRAPAAITSLQTLRVVGSTEQPQCVVIPPAHGQQLRDIPVHYLGDECLPTTLSPNPRSPKSTATSSTLLHPSQSTDLEMGAHGKKSYAFK